MAKVVVGVGKELTEEEKKVCGLSEYMHDVT